MAVVTSSVPEHCRTALTHLDLMKYFEGVTLAHDLGLEKKDPALWRAAAEHYGVAPEDCTVFDDSLSAWQGRQGCKNAGGGRLRRFLRPGRGGHAGILRRVYPEL